MIIVLEKLTVRDVMHLVLQAKPNDLNSNEIETTILTTVCGNLFDR